MDSQDSFGDIQEFKHEIEPKEAMEPHYFV